jgi:hypothetical protein
VSEVWEHYIDRKTLRWKISQDLVTHRVVGNNLILCCVRDISNRQLVCFPERHTNWKSTGYLDWHAIINVPKTDGSVKTITNREWNKEIEKVCAALAKELKAKGIVGPDTPTAVHSISKRKSFDPPRVVARYDVMKQFQGNVDEPDIPEHAYRDSVAHAAEITEGSDRKNVPLSIHYMVTSRNRYTRCGMPVERLGKSKGHVWSSSWNIVTCSECLNQKMINASAQSKRKEKARPLETTIED